MSEGEAGAWAQVVRGLVSVTDTIPVTTLSHGHSQVSLSLSLSLSHYAVIITVIITVVMIYTTINARSPKCSHGI